MDYLLAFITHRSQVFLLVLTIIISTASFSYSQTYQPTWESLDSRPMPEWFEDAKFGIFIHWGVYSVPAYRPVSKERYASYAEWYEADVMHKPGAGKDFHEKTYGKDFAYRDFAPLFKAELFNPEEWAALFKKSGARYVVLTSKHHDGFTLWPSKSPYSKGWNSMEVGPKRDLVGDITKAVRAKGLKMGLYFSLLEWETPTPSRENKPYVPAEIVKKYRIPADQYISGHIIPQLKELVTNYQPAVIFSDGAWDETSDYWQSRPYLAWLYNNAPNKNEVVVNDRWGKDVHQKHGDYYTSEYASDDDKMNAKHPWEESQGIGGSYGFNRAENLEDYKTSGELVYLLIDRVSRGGNFLLNVGPAADGTIPVIMQERLFAIGDWLDINGEAIYATKPWIKTSQILNSIATSKTAENDKKVGVVDTQAKVYFTTKGKTLYAISTILPDKALIIENLSGKGPYKVSMLGVKHPVKWKAENNKLIISPVTIHPSQLPSPFAYVFKIENAL